MAKYTVHIRRKHPSRKAKAVVIGKRDPALRRRHHRLSRQRRRLIKLAHPRVRPFSIPVGLPPGVKFHGF